MNHKGFLNLILSLEYCLNIVGTTTEASIRIISQLKKDNLISTQGKQIKIENLEKTETYSIVL